MARRRMGFLEADQEYFSSCKSYITSQNNHMLMDGCIFYGIVLCIYTVLTYFTKQPRILRDMYFAFDIIHVVFCIIVCMRTKNQKRQHRTTQLFCVILEISILSFFVLEGVYTSRTDHSLYFSIAILLVLLLFIHKIIYTYFITFIYVISYVLLSLSYKTPHAFINDVYVASATCIAAGIGYILIARMRHKEGRALCKYENLSKKDQLTGLLNKTTIESVYNKTVVESLTECTFIILDLDNFKVVNDTLGHDVGDEVLKCVGNELKKNFRSCDYVARFGGDEFVILMSRCTDWEIVRDRADSIIKRIEGIHFSNSSLQLHCSVGITMRKNNEDFQTLFRRADQALYEAKVYEKGMYRINY